MVVNGPLKQSTKRELAEVKSYEAVEEDKLVEFVREATNQLVSEMRK